MALTHVRIVGSGLIGTSIGLGLALKGVGVTMVDLDPRAQALAEDLVSSPPHGQVDLVVIATPISAFSSVASREMSAHPKAAFIDILSIKSKVKVEILSLGLDPHRFLPSHPMAGREIGGAESARADLFQSRPWIIDPQGVDREVVEKGRELIEHLGGHIVELDSTEHDQAVALISHLPQLVSSLLAKQLNGASDQALSLAGAGLRDTVRIAGSDPGLWREIITANGKVLEPLLRNLQNDLATLVADIENQSAVEKLIVEGAQGRARIPGKHGGKAREYTYLPIVIEDKPGQLAALLDECASASVNVEDLSIEHSPGQFTGLITLALSQSDAEKLSAHLEAHGWNVHTPKK